MRSKASALFGTTALLSLLAFAGQAAAADPCPNAQFRTGHSGALPDCRAYEKVSPVAKNFQNSVGWGFHATSDDGNALLLGTVLAAPGAQQGGAATMFLARRDNAGWHPGLPLELAAAPSGTDFSAFATFSPDFSHAVVTSHQALTPDGTEGPENLYIESMGERAFRLLSPKAPPQPPPVWFLNAASLYSYAGASADYSHIVYDATTGFPFGVPQTDDPVTGEKNPYEWVDGKTRLVGVLPGDALPPFGAAIGSSALRGSTLHAISGDGARVFFHAVEPGTVAASSQAGQLYVRQETSGGPPTTIPVSASQRTDCATSPGACSGTPEPDPAGAMPALYLDAEADHGSDVLFMSCEKLTDESNAGDDSPEGFQQCGSGAAYSSSQLLDGRDLYRFDVDTRELTDLTAGPGPGDVLGMVGASENLDRIYFVARAVLAGNAGARGVQASDGQPNLYLWDRGTTKFIATLDDTAQVPGDSPFFGTGAPVDPMNWGLALTDRLPASRVTQSGEQLLITARAQLGEYDNSSAACFTGRCSEVYRYDAVTDKLTCVSCGPTGVPPSGDALLYQSAYAGSKNASETPPGNLSRDGSRVFFESEDALVPDDVNGQRDVYEWVGGRVHLISSGKDPLESRFVDAAPSGSDVFFSTYEHLVGADRDDNSDIYDAREGGGFGEPPSPAPPCVLDACQGQPTAPPALPGPGTSNQSGRGNVRPGPRPRFSVRRLSPRARAKLAQGKRAILHVRVNQPGTVSVVARARLLGRRHIIARASRKITKAGSASLRLRVSRAARDRLANGRRLTITLTVRFSGVREAENLRLTLRPIANSKKSRKV